MGKVTSINLRNMPPKQADAIVRALRDNTPVASSSADEAIAVDEITNAAVRRQLIRLAAEQVDLQATIKELESQKEVNQIKITELGKKNKLGKVRGDRWLMLPPSSRRVLKKELLIEQGSHGGRW